MHRNFDKFCFYYRERVSEIDPNVVILMLQPEEVVKIHSSDRSEQAQLKAYVGEGNFTEFRDPSIAVTKNRADTVHAILGRIGLVLQKA